MRVFFGVFLFDALRLSWLSWGWRRQALVSSSRLDGLARHGHIRISQDQDQKEILINIKFPTQNNQKINKKEHARTGIRTQVSSLGSLHAKPLHHPRCHSDWYKQRLVTTVIRGRGDSPLGVASSVLLRVVSVQCSAA